MRAGIYDAAGALAHMTECAIASTEGLPVRTSKHERARLTSIADEGLRFCACYVTAECAHTAKCPRVERWLRERGDPAVNGLK